MNVKKLLLAFALLTAGFAYDAAVYKITQWPTDVYPGGEVLLKVLVKNTDPQDNILDVSVVVNSTYAEIYPENISFHKIEPYGIAEASFVVKLPSECPEVIPIHVFLYQGDTFIEKRTYYLSVQKGYLWMDIPLKEIDAGNCSTFVAWIHATKDVGNLGVSISSSPALIVKKTYYTLGDIAKNSIKKLKFTVCANSEAPSGYYPLLLQVEYTVDTPVTKVFEQMVYIRNSPKLIIAGIKTSPEKIRFGDDGKVTVYIDNLSPEPAYGVKFTVENVSVCRVEQDIFWADSAVYRGVPSKIEISCKNFNVTGNAWIGGRLEYFDKEGVRYSKAVNIPLTVHRAPKIEIINYTVDYLGGSRLKLYLLVKNAGQEDAKNVDVEIELDWPFSTTQKRDFLGNMKPGEIKEATVFLEVYPNAQEKHYGVSVRVHYSDEDGDKYEDTEDISIKIVKENFFRYGFNWIKRNMLFFLFSIGVLGFIIYSSVIQKEK